MNELHLKMCFFNSLRVLTIFCGLFQRGRLQAHEENFDRKVDEVDERYKQKVNNLLMQNAELRKSFRKKCEELAIERYEADEAHQANIEKLKDKMEVSEFLYCMAGRLQPF